MLRPSVPRGLGTGGRQQSPQRTDVVQRHALALEPPPRAVVGAAGHRRLPVRRSRRIFSASVAKQFSLRKEKRKKGGGPKRPGASAGNLPVAPRLGLIFHLNAIYGCTPRVDAWLPHALRGGRGRLLPKEPSEVLEAFFRGHELGTPFVSCVPELAQSWRRHRALSRVLPYLPLEPHCSTKQALPIQGPGLAGPLIGLR